MTTREEKLQVLGRGLDQATTLFGSVTEDDLTAVTPCDHWTTSELVDHLVEAPARFAQMVRGERVDWSAATPHVDGERGEVFRGNASALLSAWGDVGDGDASIDPDWQSAEIAVHTYDLASAIGYPTGDLDPEVAERGLVFMQANLTADNRAPAFEQEQPAPDGADAYQRLAAFAGRTVTPSR